MRMFVRAAILAVFLVVPMGASAEQAAPAAEQAAMPCPHAGKDGCCGGACAEMQAKAAAAGTTNQAAQGEEGGCPCQRARAAKAAAEAAEAAKQAQP